MICTCLSHNTTCLEQMSSFFSLFYVFFPFFFSHSIFSHVCTEVLHHIWLWCIIQPSSSTRRNRVASIIRCPEAVLSPNRPRCLWKGWDGTFTPEHDLLLTGELLVTFLLVSLGCRLQPLWTRFAVRHTWNHSPMVNFCPSVTPSWKCFEWMRWRIYVYLS